jgi:hypothetical protein
MRRLVFVALLTLPACLPCSPEGARAQGWARTYEGPAAEGLLALDEGPGGQLRVAAWTDSFGTASGDGWLLQLDAGGAVLSESVVGDPERGGADGAAFGLNGGALFVGRNVVDFFLKHDAWAIRVDAAGVVQWARLFARPGLGRHFLLDATWTVGGGWTAVGTSALDDTTPQAAWFVRIDDFGSVLWQQEHGSGAADSLVACDPTDDGGVVAVGSTTAPGAGGEDALVVKYDALGGIQWQRQVGGGSTDQATAAAALAGGGHAVAGVTQSFTASGRAPWLLRFDAAGDLVWHVVFGDQEWGDFQAVIQTTDGALVALGRLAEPGFPTNDLWAVKVAEADGTVLWQRAYEGPQGEFADELIELSDGGLLLGATWAWGFPEEALALLRTDYSGHATTCGLERDTSVSTSRPRLTTLPGPLSLLPPAASSLQLLPVTGPSVAVVADLCLGSCSPLSCDAIGVQPGPPCEPRRHVLDVTTTGGEGALVVEWDVDGDGAADAFGSPVEVVLEPGQQEVVVTVRDACATPGPQECTLGEQVSVPADPPAPGEVSDVRAGAAPLLVLDEGVRLVVEAEPASAGFHVYSDAIGRWGMPSAGTGSDCARLDWAALPGGRAEMAVSLASDTWVLVTGASACAEGPAGVDSLGAARDAGAGWEACGPLP